MKIGIIGCGYLGQAVALRWKQEGHHLAVTTRKTDRIADLQLIAHDVCLLNSTSLSSFIEQQEILLISVAPDSSSDYGTTYLQTAQQVAKQAATAKSLRQILYTSSCSVYGDQGGAWVDETTPVTPLHANAQILFETEQVLLRCRTPHLQVCILRLGEIYGPEREIEKRLKCTHHQPFAGTGESFTNLIHLEDLVEALNFALIKSLDGIYNVCNDFHLPRCLFYEMLCQKEHIPPIQWDPSRIHSHQGNRKVCNQKLKAKGFTFIHPNY